MKLRNEGASIIRTNLCIRTRGCCQGPPGLPGKQGFRGRGGQSGVQGETGPIGTAGLAGPTVSDSS